MAGGTSIAFGSLFRKAKNKPKSPSKPFGYIRGKGWSFSFIPTIKRNKQNRDKINKWTNKTFGFSLFDPPGSRSVVSRFFW